MRRFTSPVVLMAIIVLTACGSSAADSSDDVAPTNTDPPSTSVFEDTSGEQQFPDVVGAQARGNDGNWTFDVTISSPYDSIERYADAWRILGPDGEEYGVRVLSHHHAAEQPFTRSLSGVEIPESIDVVTIEARDLQFGWGGTTFDVQLP